MKTRLLLTLLLLCSLASAATSSYDVTIEEGGNALVVLVISGEGTVNVPLPLDVGSPTVEGGIYLTAENGIDIVVIDSASVIYKSNLLTIDQEGVWVFDLELSDTATSSLTLSLPKTVSIQESSPAATITQTDDSVNLLWTLSGDNLVTVSYTLGELSSEASTQQPADYSMIIIVLVVIVILLAVFLLKKKTSKAKPVTSGKQNVLKTLTDNERSVVEALMRHGGEIRRNKLEKLTGISKSSLAGTLTNLESRNVVEIDKSRNVHLVALSGWFSSL